MALVFARGSGVCIGKLLSNLGQHHAPPNLSRPRGVPAWCSPRPPPMLSRLPQICVISRIPGLRAALDARGVNTAGMEWHAELDSPAAQQSLARCEVVRYAENTLTQPSASWLSGGSSQRHAVARPEPSGPPNRPSVRLFAGPAR